MTCQHQLDRPAHRAHRGVIERPLGGGLEGEYAPEYLVEPEHIKEGAEVLTQPAGGER